MSEGMKHKHGGPGDQQAIGDVEGGPDVVEGIDFEVQPVAHGVNLFADLMGLTGESETACVPSQARHSHPIVKIAKYATGDTAKSHGEQSIFGCARPKEPVDNTQGRDD